MNYSNWIITVCGLLEYEVVDVESATPTGVASFDSCIPAAIDYTENRIQRDLNLISTQITSQGAMAANLRRVTLPTSVGVYIVCSQICPFVAGVRQQPLEPVTRDYLDFAWPSDASPGAGILPVQWCPDDQATILVGPAPDQNYTFEAVGTMRVVQMSAANTTNFLSLQLPDLYVAASMVWWSGFQRDFGSQSDDPKLATSWEEQYQTLLKGATVEEIRKQYADLFPSPSTPLGLTAQSG